LSVCCVVSGRDLCVVLITRPDDPYRLWCVVVCDLENLMNEEALAHWGLSRRKQIRLVRESGCSVFTVNCETNRAFCIERNAVVSVTIYSRFFVISGA